MGKGRLISVIGFGIAVLGNLAFVVAGSCFPGHMIIRLLILLGFMFGLIGAIIQKKQKSDSH